MTLHFCNVFPVNFLPQDVSIHRLGFTSQRKEPQDSYFLNAYGVLDSIKSISNNLHFSVVKPI